MMAALRRMTLMENIGVQQKQTFPTVILVGTTGATARKIAQKLLETDLVVKGSHANLVAMEMKIPEV